MNITKTLLTFTLLMGVVACGGESRPDLSTDPAQDNMRSTEPAATNASEPAESCLSQNCSYEISQCNSKCAELLDCVTVCTRAFDTDEDLQWCAAACVDVAGETATRQLDALFTCNEQACL